MTQQLDVREIAPRDRHPKIFDLFDGLKAGDSFELINDHDPKPLFYQLCAERSDQFRWDYLELGPETWRVRIKRVREAAGPEKEEGCCGCCGA